MDIYTILQEMLLTESVSVGNVNDAIDNKYRVILNYRTKGKDKATGKRIVEPYAYGLTKAGNPVMRGYQPYGDTTTKVPGWKFFRLDRVIYWEKTDYTFNKPISDYTDAPPFNPDGDETMSIVYNIAKFGDDDTKPKNLIGKIPLDQLGRKKSIYTKEKEPTQAKSVLKKVDQQTATVQEPTKEVTPEPTTDTTKQQQPNMVRQMSPEEFAKQTKGWKSPFKKQTPETVPHVPNVEELLLEPQDQEPIQEPSQEVTVEPTTDTTKPSNMVRQMSPEEFAKQTKGWKSPFNKNK